MTDALRNRVGSVVLHSHSLRALLASWALLVKTKQNLENQIRGLLKNLALVIGRAKFNVFAVRAEELIEDRPELIAMVGLAQCRASRNRR
jgi:transposase